MAIKFSAVTITRNEEERIGKWLDSVRWCDEKIVVDDDSTDKTREIAVRMGAKVIRKTKNTEATQWRFALSLAKGDWIIWGGADQWLDQELIKDIKKRVGKEEFVGYMVTMQELFLGHKLKIKEIEDYKALWVIKRAAMKLPQVLVHQNVEVKGKVGVLNGVMYHDSFRNFDQIFSKFNYYTTLQALEAFNQGRRTSIPRIFFAPVYTFFWRQIKLKEYRDGALGLLLSIAFGVDKLFFHLKLWELEARKKTKNDP